MLFFVPIAVKLIVAAAVGGTVVGGLKTAKKRKLPEKAKRVLRRSEQNYQRMVRRHVDPLFGSRRRNRQMGEFADSYSEKERALNHQLGVSFANIAVAWAGVSWFPPLLLINAGALAYLMWPPIRDGLDRVFREKRPNYRLVGSLSVLFNFVAGFYVIGSIMISVVLLAFKLSARSEAYSRKALGDAFALHTPDSVWVLVDGVELEMPFSKLNAGDVLVLNAGQPVPVDGIIIHGMATLDQHRLTGESQPVERTVGDKVLASTLLLSGKLHVEVECTGSDTAAAQIAEILNNTANYRLDCAAHSERLADKLTLPMLAASALGLFSIGSNAAVTILNSGFGSTMFIAGPLSMLSYLNLASRQGILVKDGRSLETLHEVDMVVFDKTGTLTLEQPEVAMIHCHGNWRETDILTLAATAEHRQTHPVARAILAAAEQRGLDWEAPEQADYSLGFGIRVELHGQVIRVGSGRFMTQGGLVIPEEVVREQSRCAAHGCSLIMVAVDDAVVGALELQAQLRAETPELIEQLHARGLKLAILSGDHEAPTRHLAERLGIDEYFAEVLPEGKAAQIKQLQQAGRVVCFVGDGINDAIALQQADVSVSLRGATTIATDSAQVVLTSGSLHQLAHLLELAEGFNKNLNRTLKLSYVPGGILIGGVFFLHFGMAAALALYSAGLAGAIGNALYPIRELKEDKDPHDLPT